MQYKLSSVPERHFSQAPIFILGITQRSGTNYLYDLLRLHPDCVSGSAIWEDFLVAHSDLLVEYADNVYEQWRSNPKIDAVFGRPDEVICASIGGGLLNLLDAQPAAVNAVPALNGVSAPAATAPRRFITKTPSVVNLRHFFRLFPNAHLLIVIRDGRAVVESTVRSFKVSFDWALHRWAKAAQTIVEFEQEAASSGGKYLIVRYEDVISDTKRELRRILRFVELDPDVYDFEAAVTMRVRGSSELRKNGQGAVHWVPVEKTAAFKPLSRASNWKRFQHERFNWVAGRGQRALRYEMRTYPASLIPWAAWNMALDVMWRARTALRWIYRRARGKRTHLL